MKQSPSESARLVSPSEFSDCLRWALSRCEPARAETVRRQLAVGRAQQRPIVTAAVTRGEQWRSVAMAIPQPAASATLVLLTDERFPAETVGWTGGADQALRAAFTNFQPTCPSDSTLVRVLQPLTQTLRSLGVTFLQASTETPAQAQRLRSVGFRPIAELALMSLEAEDFAAALRSADVALATAPARLLDARCAWVPLERVGRDWQSTLTDLIAETFRQTLDCPALADFRSPTEIARGYLDSPDMDRGLSRLLRIDDEWAAVLVLSLHASAALAVPGVAERDLTDEGSSEAILELSYMGVACRWRGADLGVRLVTAAVSQAMHSQAARIVLAVDLENGPAVEIYRRLGWQECLREVVWGRRL